MVDCAPAYQVRFDEDPFPHLVIDDFVPRRILDAVQPRLESVQLPWYRYNGVFETGKEVVQAPTDDPDIRFIMERLDGLSDELDHWFGCDPELDWSTEKSGLQRSLRGGRLDVHLDHTHSSDGRRWRLKGVVYLHRYWNKSWGGALELWKTIDCDPVPVAVACRKRYLPKPGRLVVMANGKLSGHGHSEPLECPDSVTRLSLLCSWFGDEDGVPRRPRAFFIPRFFDLPDGWRVEERLQRAGLAV